MQVHYFPKMLDEKIGERIISSMKFATKAGGSARKGDIHGFKVAAKTGTGEKVVNGKYSKKAHYSSFLGAILNKEQPLVIYISMDEAEAVFIPGIGKNHYGGNAAGPTFKAMGSRMLDYLGVTPDDPHGYPKNDPRYDFEKADWIKETDRLQEMYKKWNK